MHTGFLALSPHHRPDITEILLNRTQNPKSPIHLPKNQIKLIVLNHFFQCLNFIINFEYWHRLLPYFTFSSDFLWHGADRRDTAFFLILFLRST